MAAPDTKSQLRERFARLPKVELHRHLEGSLRLETLLELVKSESLDLPHDAAALRREVQVQHGEAMTSQNFLSKFNALRQFYRSDEILRRITRETITDAAEDNIHYLELRFTPVALARARDYPLDEVVDWVVQSAYHTAEACGIRIGLIASVNRHEPVELAEEVAKIAADRLGKGIVGLDLAGNEVEFAADPFQPIFAEAKGAGLKITVHAGEWTGAASVRHALEKMGAARIGHGVRVMEDPDVIKLALERRAVFEVCLTSNHQSGVVASLREHPLPKMIDAGLQVTLNTDDPGVSNITLTDEYQIAVTDLGLSEASLKGLVLAAAQASFLPPREKKALEAELQEKLMLSA